MTVFHSCARRVAQVVASYQVAAISALVVAILVGTLSTDFSASTSRRFLVAEGNACDGCANLTTESERSACYNSCSTPPSSASYSSYGEYNSSSYSSYGEYHSAGSAGSYNSAMPCPPPSPSPNHWCNYNTGAWESSGGGSSTSWSSGGGWEASPEVQAACRSRCEATGKYSAADCQMYCRDGDFEGPGGGGGGCTGTPPPNSWCENGAWKTGGGSGSGDRSYWSQALGKKVSVWNTMDCDAQLSVIPDLKTREEEKKWCYQALGISGGGGSTGEYGSTGGSGGGSSMRNCFYTNATINGKHPGYSIQCEQDYYNCFAESISSGKRISTEGLALGAPSQCESGWGGGAGYGSDGGFSGGGDINCCLPTPECKPGTTPCPSYMPKCITVKPGQNPPAGYTCGGGEGYGGGYGGHGDYGFDGGFGDNMGDFAGYGGHPGPGDDDGQLAREKMDMVRNLSQRGREIKDMRRSLKDSRSGDTALAAEIDAFEKDVTAVSKCFEGATDFDMMRDCYDRHNEINDRTQEIWAKIQVLNLKGNQKNEEREFKDMAREIERLKREKQDTAELESIFGQIQSTSAKIQSLIETDPEKAQWLTQDLGDLKRTFWDTMQSLQQEEHMKEFEMHLSSACRDLKREVSRLPKESRKNGEDILRRCEALVAQVRVDMQNTDDPFIVGEDFRFAIEDLWRELQESREDEWMQSDCRDVERILAEAGRAIHEEAPQIIDEVHNPSIANQMEELLEEAQDIWGEGVRALKAGDCERAIDIADALDADIRPQFEGLMDAAGVDFEGGGEFVDFDEHYRDFYNEGGFGEFDLDFDTFDNYLEENEYDMNTLSLAKKIAGSILAEYLKRQQGVDGGTDLLSVAAGMDMDTVLLQNLMDTKSQLLAQIEDLKAQVTSLKGELKAIADEVAAYIFAPETQDKVEDFLADLGNLTVPEAEEQLEGLRAESQEAFREAELTPYLDVNPFEQSWMVDAVTDMTNAGYFSGVDSDNFAPEKDTNAAELVKTLGYIFEVNDADPELITDDPLAEAMPEWALPSAAGVNQLLADQGGPTLSEIFDGGQPGDSVTRIEFARLLYALHADSFDETSGTEVLGGYTDLDGLSDEDRAAVAFVVDAGLMTGTGDKWDPYGPCIRGQFAVIMDRFGEWSGDFGHEGSDYDYEEEGTEGSDFGGEDEDTSYQSDEEEMEFHSAGEEEFDSTTEESVSSEEEVQAPAYYYDSMVTKAQLSEVQEGVVYYQAQHKTISEYTSTIKDVAEILTGMAKKFEPYAGVPTWKLNICNEFVGKETEVLRMIMSELGRPINC